MNPNDKKATKWFLISGIPIVIIAAISLYFLLDGTICKGKEGLGHAFCGLGVTIGSIIFGLFGIIFIIICLVQLSKKNQNPNQKKSTPAKIIGKTIVWTILILLFVFSLLAMFFTNITLGNDVVEILVAASSFTIMLVLLLRNKAKNEK